MLLIANSAEIVDNGNFVKQNIIKWNNSTKFIIFIYPLKNRPSNETNY